MTAAMTAAQALALAPPSASISACTQSDVVMAMDLPGQLPWLMLFHLVQARPFPDRDIWLVDLAGINANTIPMERAIPLATQVLANFPGSEAFFTLFPSDRDVRAANLFQWLGHAFDSIHYPFPYLPGRPGRGETYYGLRTGRARGSSSGAPASSAPSANGPASPDEQNRMSDGSDSPRWTLSRPTLPDGTLLMAHEQPNGIFLTARDRNHMADLPTPNQELGFNTYLYHMYPFVHLVEGETPFALAARSSRLVGPLDVTTVNALNDEAGHRSATPRPAGAVLLPMSSANNWDPDVLICCDGSRGDGASQPGPSSGPAQPGPSSGPAQPSSAESERDMDAGMMDGIPLPNGTVLWIKGATRGTQGTQVASDLPLKVLIYNPEPFLGRRWTSETIDGTLQLYGATAKLLLNGQVQINGSNRCDDPLRPRREDCQYVYTPPYLRDGRAARYPARVWISTKELTAGSPAFAVDFRAPRDARSVRIAVHLGGHTSQRPLHLAQRMLFLDAEGWVTGKGRQSLRVTPPPTRDVFPPGQCVLYVVVDDVPSEGTILTVV